MISQQEFEAILDDGTKRIEGDLRWRDDEDHSPAQEFRVQVLSEPGWPLTAIGWWNPRSGKLSYTLRHDAAGRILGLDLGPVTHRNPSSERLCGTHKHRWTAQFRDKQAYIPDDITAEWDQPVKVWEQFCSEVRITHLGTMDYPSAGGIAVMRLNEMCQSIRDSLPGLYECALTPRGTTQVRTPMLYPDGGIVDVYISESADHYVVTGFGDALGWLRMQFASGKLSPKQRLMLDDVILTQGVDLDRGELRMNCKDMGSLGEAVQRVAQTAMCVSDLWFTFRTRRVESIADEVDEWLRQRPFEFNRSVRYNGRSGLKWTVDYQVTAESHTSLMFLLSSGSRAAARRVSERVVAGCIDLMRLQESKRFFLISLFDDTSDVWQPEDFNLVEIVSEAVMWSRPDELERVLTAL